VVLWRLRYKLALRDLPEMFLIRSIVFSHEAVRDWEAKLTPALAENLRRRRRGKVGRSWYVDESVPRTHGPAMGVRSCMEDEGRPLEADRQG
jgi:putative transposase